MWVNDFILAQIAQISQIFYANIQTGRHRSGVAFFLF